MAQKLKLYTVKQLALLSGVSVRTLHHYDAIDLLKPAHIGDNSYRYYGREELLRLQDILFHRELGIPLAEIAKLLAQGGRDRLSVLEGHRDALTTRLQHTNDLLCTIHRTIADLQGEYEMSDTELYHGFAPEKQAQYEAELIAHLGQGAAQDIATSRAHLGSLDKAWMEAAVERGEQAEAALAIPFADGVPADAAELEPLFDAHRAWVAHMWGKECPANAYDGLADLYLSHPDFHTHFDTRGAGFTDWIAAGMKAYGARQSG